MVEVCPWYDRVAACIAQAAAVLVPNLLLPNVAAVAAADTWAEQTSATSATAAFESNQVGPFLALLAASVGSGLLAC